MRPMSDGLGWSRTTITAGSAFQALSNLVLAPVLGIIVDRYGPRMVMVLGACIASVSYMFMTRVTEPWQFYILYTSAVSVGLYEVGNFVTTTVVSKWFIRLRGRALAFTTLGIDAGTATLAPVAAFLAASIGWRNTWGVLGVIIAAVVIPPSTFFMRRTPEDMGLRPDGDPPDLPPQPGNVAAPPRPARRVEQDWTPREAFRTRALWQLVIAMNLASIGASALFLHIVSYITDTGLSLQTASLVVSVHGLAAIGSKLIYGFLAERIPIRFCLGANVAGRALGYFILLIGQAPWRVFVFAPLGGLTGSAFAPLSAQIWADYYGRASVGAIRGFITPLSLIASVTGPLGAAYAYDELGSYDRVFWLYAGLLLVSAVMIFTAKPPVHPAAVAAATT